ncbi:CBM96 family carbohydrate-binding protein [Tunicatimonas pelagia]|uniref:CBM96 family carbohydrate-binding protein n=1 Tax=Tunicatimonas pelagia TaxID=931531 RepID=UPI002666AA7B|nr:DNRLRE domain-containing protein [Tunicatimonas pelagia]WKN44032.1 DNRLRE domain-containing protein [Tunicatimonas pelagia]
MRTLTNFCFLLSCCLCVSTYAQTTYYVAPAGSNSNDGLSPANAWQTIAYALANVTSGQGHTIQLSAGEFTENSVLTIPNGVNLVGAGSEQTTVKVNYFYDITTVPRQFADGRDAGYDPAPEECVIQMNGRDHLIKGFKLDGQNRQSHGGIRVDTAANMVFEDLHITQFRYVGLWVQVSDNVVVRDSKFINTSFPNTVRCSGSIMFFRGKDVKVYNNELREDELESYTVMLFDQDQDAFFENNNRFRGNPPVLRNFEFYENTCFVLEVGAWQNRQSPAITMNMIGASALNWDIHHNWFNNTVSMAMFNNQTFGLQSTERSVRLHHNYWDMGYNEYRYAIETIVPHMEIDHNIFSGGLYPLATFGGNPKPSGYRDHKIHHNVFYNPSSAFINSTNGRHEFGFEVAFYNDFPEDFQFVNNTIIDTTARGLNEYFRKQLSPEVAGVGAATIANNIFISTNKANNNPREGFDAEDFLDPLVSNNLFYQTGSFGDAAIRVNPNEGPESILKFAGELQESYFELAEGSPAIDAGIYLPGLRLEDYNGPAPDLGAFESGSGGPTTNIPPQGEITSPRANTPFFSGDVITVTVDASDFDGSVASAAFFLGSTKLGEDTTAPYRYDWEGAFVGTYQLTIRITDDSGTVTTTDPVTVVVSPLADYTIGAEADAFVRGGNNANNNFNTEELTVRGVNNVNITFHSYLRFSTDEIESDTDQIQLALQVTSAQDGRGEMPIDIAFVADDSWDESQITWNTKPAGSTNVGRLIVGSDDEGIKKVIDVTDLVQNARAANGDGKVSFVLTMPSSVDATVIFGSKESAAPAALEVIRASSSVRRSTPPVADAFVRGGSFSQDNYGQETELVVKKVADNTFSRYSYLRFSLDDIRGEVDFAQLVINALAIDIQGQGPVELYRVDNDQWDENNITWANRPACGQRLGEIVVDKNTLGVQTLDITEVVSQETDGVLSLALVQPANAAVGVTFGSRESNTSPALVYTTALRSVKPVLENGGRLTYNPADTTYTARFGYYNQNAGIISIPVGAKSRFTGPFQDRGQTVNFLPGRQRGVFEVILQPGETTVWTLTGPDGKRRTSTVSAPHNTNARVAERQKKGIGSEIGSVDDLILYPNPAQRTLHLSGLATESAQLSISDMLGRVVLKEALSGSSADIDVSQLHPGLYVLSIERGGQDDVTHKLLIE